MQGSCNKGDTPLTNDGWLRAESLPFQCYFYPMRDCPGWNGGGICSRIGNLIPENDSEDK